MKKFNIGDKVRVTGMRGHWHGFDSGDVVNVVDVRTEGAYSILYRCEGKRGLRQWVSPADLELFDSTAPDKIVVTVDGDKVLARMYRGKEKLREAEATCSKKDTFDFETGARLAFHRLLGEKPEPQKMFPLEDIKAGYLLVVKNVETRETFNMTVVPGRIPGGGTALGCCYPRRRYWPLRQFGENLDYDGASVLAVYGPTSNCDLLANSIQGRELLWKRK